MFQAGGWILQRELMLLESLERLSEGRSGKSTTAFQDTKKLQKLLEIIAGDFA